MTCYSGRAHTAIARRRRQGAFLSHLHGFSLSTLRCFSERKATAHQERKQAIECSNHECVLYLLRWANYPQRNGSLGLSAGCQLICAVKLVRVPQVVAFAMGLKAAASWGHQVWILLERAQRARSFFSCALCRLAASILRSSCNMQVTLC